MVPSALPQASQRPVRSKQGERSISVSRPRFTLGQEDKPEEERKRICDGWREFLWFKGQMELLLYAQRDFLYRRFPDYDPARKDFWKGHNRPWDYDHILAKTYVHSKQEDHKRACGEWLNTIGNFRAWPMEDNRSEQAEPALEKLSGDSGEVRRQDSFLEDDELPAFSHAHETKKPEAATAFVTACRDRMLRIYRVWYETVGVVRLIPTANDASAHANEFQTSNQNAKINTSNFQP